METPAYHQTETPTEPIFKGRRSGEPHSTTGAGKSSGGISGTQPMGNGRHRSNRGGHTQRRPTTAAETKCAPPLPARQQAALPHRTYRVCEIKQAIQRFKKKKCPGVDGCETELFTSMNEDIYEQIQITIQEWWATKEVPQDLTHAKVISLYKKGDPADPGNYRPISLLNTMYKIYAIILRLRLEEGIELILGETQYGFRSRRSTSEPIYCIRRIIAYLERGDGDGVIMFLDWEKAFDKLYQSRIWETMHRFGVPNALINAVTRYTSMPPSQSHWKDTPATNTNRNVESGKDAHCHHSSSS